MASTNLARCCMKAYTTTYGFTDSGINCNNNYTYTIGPITFTGGFGQWNEAFIKGKGCTTTYSCSTGNHVIVLLRIGCIPNSIDITNVVVNYYENGVWQGNANVSFTTPTPCTAGECTENICGGGS